MLEDFDLNELWRYLDSGILPLLFVLKAGQQYRTSLCTALVLRRAPLITYHLPTINYILLELVHLSGILGEYYIENDDTRTQCHPCLGVIGRFVLCEKWYITLQGQDDWVIGVF